MAGLTAAEQIQRLQEQQKELEAKIAKAKERQMINIGKLADKHGLTMWDQKKLDKAFAFLAENQSDSFDTNNSQPNQ
ncbi:hypothetical protein [Francisella philomiragia]|uniref:hypothetical protein n=1 Tax=Francisella philomiragia TaxID=28110 RepID=UPI0019048322|nr:hypothetical protein [Francisella philomiragia]MBK2270196.1 hypothetical protein [Francisella philomiragia]MBK2275860.1 hypothetical protein [Francisella philomiragia]MBK2305073.1 hypothetical protein [Francisella philomiragia]